MEFDESKVYTVVNIDLDKAVADCLEKNRKRAEGTGDKI